MSEQNITLLKGDETFLVEEAKRAICKQNDTWEHTVISTSTNLNELSQQLSSVSLFSPNTLYTWDDPELLCQTLETSDITRLEQLLTSLSDQQKLVISFFKKTLDARKKPAKLIKKLGIKQQNFDAFKDWEQSKIQDWIKGRVQKHNKTIGPDAVALLETFGGTHLRFLAGEIEKLVTYVGSETHISKDAVLACSASDGQSMFALSSALPKRQKKVMIGALTDLFNHGEEPLRLLALIANAIRLYTVISHDSKTQSLDSIATTLKKNPYYIKRLADDIKKAYTFSDLQTLMAAVATTDMNIKTGKMSGQVALMQLVHLF